MERKLGDKFLTPEGVELEVIEGNDCDECFVNSDSSYCDEYGDCCRFYRKDKKNVIFKQTK